MGEFINEYFNPKAPGSYGGLDRFQRHHPDIDMKTLQANMTDERAYTLHRPVRNNFRRNRILVSTIDYQWDVDLADMTSYADENDGYRYWLCVIDIFSKKGWIVPTKSKTATEIVKAFESLFNLTNRRAEKIRSNPGGEFKNMQLLKFLKKHGIEYFNTFNTVHASVAERFIRSIKMKVFRMMTHRRSNRYIDHLADIISSYNASYHRSIKMRPNDVNEENQHIVLKNLYPPRRGKTRSKYGFKVGDHVRISSYRMIFRKGYETGWSEEIFRISKRIPRSPPVYEVVDLNGDAIHGTFYTEQLQKVTMKDDVFIVEKVLKQRRRNGRVQYFVRFLGYPKSFDTWVDQLEP